MRKVFFIVSLVISIIALGLYGVFYFIPTNKSIDNLTRRKLQVLKSIDSLRNVEHSLDPIKDSLRMINDSIESIKNTLLVDRYTLRVYGNVRNLDDTTFVLTKSLNYKKLSGYLAELKNYPRVFKIDSLFITQKRGEIYLLKFYISKPLDGR